MVFLVAAGVVILLFTGKPAGLLLLVGSAITMTRGISSEHRRQILGRSTPAE